MRIFLLMIVFLFFLFLSIDFPLDSHFKSLFVFKKERYKKERFKKIEVVSTAYYRPLKNQKKFLFKSYQKEIKMNGNGITYSGKKARIGTIAADLRFFPLGTKMYIPGYGWGEVEDIGSRIKNNKIDIYVGEGEEGLKRAIEWGKRRIVIKILKEEDSF